MNPFKITKEKLMDLYYQPPSLQAHLITESSSIESSKMNPFEALSDYPILHIFSYLPCNDLLTFTLMDKRFNRIITESNQMAKIPLVLDFDDQIVIENVIELANNRRISALKIKNFDRTISEDFLPLMECLRGSVENLEIHSSCHGNFDDYCYHCIRLALQPRAGEPFEDQFRKLIQIFLPNLKTCDVGYIDMTVNSRAIIKDGAILNHPLKSLRVGNAGMVNFFSGCKQLKSFEFRHKGNTDFVYEFLFQQTQLEKLTINCSRVDLSRMILIQLKELSLTSSISYDDDSTVSEYLESLPNLTKLHLRIGVGSSPNRLMKVICNAPKLEDLDIGIDCSNPDIQLQRLENHTVKKLRIVGAHNEVTGVLLQIFRGVESVGLVLLRQQSERSRPFYMKPNANLSDPSNIPQETIDKIRFEPEKEPLRIMFSPVQVPSNVGSFESFVMNFSVKFSAKIVSITIGHNNWRNNRDFQLSNVFCEGLVKSLPNLNMLELFNIADHGGFISFLDRNRKTLKNLNEVKLHRPNDEDEPESKNMRI